MTAVRDCPEAGSPGVQGPEVLGEDAGQHVRRAAGVRQRAQDVEYLAPTLKQEAVKCLFANYQDLKRMRSERDQENESRFQNITH